MVLMVIWIVASYLSNRASTNFSAIDGLTPRLTTPIITPREILLYCGCSTLRFLHQEVLGVLGVLTRSTHLGQLMKNVCVWKHLSHTYWNFYTNNEAKLFPAYMNENQLYIFCLFQCQPNYFFDIVVKIRIVTW